ncbi:META domain-containing protein [Psychromonas antarctica]|uniref:META domain-containing protein n=1 Tax=Psychromonas antarctica TaxID=67573 RepID=UPI001EE97235|nr:META domain-containing protein [Psychromonas antarctica]MCG6201577.1 META domain-containing protein [Psychromonas antarctica]
MKFIKPILLIFSALSLGACSADMIQNSKIENKAVELSQIQQQWILVSVDKQLIPANIRSKLTISAGAKATGTLGCNHFFGAIKLQNNKFKIDKIASTRKMCTGQGNEIEMIVSTVLGNWSELLVNTDKLTLIGQIHRLEYKITP